MPKNKSEIRWEDIMSTLGLMSEDEIVEFIKNRSLQKNNSEYDTQQNKKDSCHMKWKKVEQPKNDQNYLVCWRQEDFTYSIPHRAYYDEQEDKFFSLENNNSHPLYVDLFIELPDPNQE